MKDNGKNFLREPDFKFLSNERVSKKLPYPTHPLVVGEDTCEVYEIPRDELQNAIDIVNPFPNLPLKITDRRHGFIADKNFTVSKCLIIRYKRKNFIVSPWFVENGETIMFWTKIHK